MGSPTPSHLILTAGLMTRNQTAKGIAIVLAMLALGRAHGYSLGDVLSQSAVGEPLRLEIQVAASAEKDEVDCLRVASGPARADDGIPYLREGNIALRSSGGQTFAVVRTRRPVFEPVVRLVLADVCESRVRREYTLLLPEPSDLRPVASTAGPATSQASSVQPAPRRAESVAPAPAPRAQTRPERAAKPSRAATNAPPPRPATKPKPPAAKSAAGKPADRLMLDTSEPQAPPAPAVPGAREAASAQKGVSQRELALRAAIDERIARQDALTERIRKLESQLAAIRRSVEAMPDAATAAATASVAVLPPESSGESRGGLIAATVGVALVALGGLVAWRRKSAPEAGDPALAPDFVLAPSVPGAEPTETAEERLPEAASAEREVAPPEDYDEALDLQAIQASEEEVQHLALEPDDPIEEHESALELAEIMLSFGRIQGAAETLVEYIRANPKGAIAPWLKLLEIYHANNMRTEFEGLTTKLHRSFNVELLSWNDYPRAASSAASLGDMPHIAARLRDSWGTQAAVDYLELLLTDNREGTREGFPLAMIDDIVVLSAILKRQLSHTVPAE
jgi:TolA-binding protein